ncbi:phosphoribosylglycinamide formyltransferase [Flavihumibacter solisilvae]|uniref:phosphoribosylglycinamide formyltransferase n=1 Tax=Flavihumibacter solisilvae TaxID=1349421 RepID=UPI001F080243|nr:phosphoribosylglycinamide formyltransferase [Flavihumibacter solisilvae]
MTLIWPLMVLFVSIPFGQFIFFRGYLLRMASHLRRSNSPIENPHAVNTSEQPYSGTPAAPDHHHHHPILLAVFASGTGSNAEKIMDHFAEHPRIKVALVVSNKPAAGVLEKAAARNVPTLIIEKENFFRGDSYIPFLKEKGIDFIVLAGFLWKIPAALITAFPSHIVNIHPALLPKYGGKGMYGQFVHEAVIIAGEQESGITIHFVDEHYDHGGTIFQATCQLEPGDTAASLAERIHELEHAHYPAIIEQTVLKQVVKH